MQQSPPLSGSTAQAYQTNPAVKKFLDAMAKAKGSATFQSAQTPNINPQGGTGSTPYGPQPPSNLPILPPFANFNPSMGTQVDQGWDLQTAVGTPVLAAGPGTIQIQHDPGGFGSSYPVLDLTNPIDGQNAIYYGEVDPTVAAGTQVQAGQPIAVTDAQASDSSATGPGVLEMGFWNQATGRPVGNGSLMEQLLTASQSPNQAAYVQSLLNQANDPNVQANAQQQASLIGQKGYNTDINQLVQQNAQAQLGFANQSVKNANLIREQQAQQIAQQIGTTEQQQQYQEGQYGLSQAGYQQQLAQLAANTQKGLFNQESADTAGGTLMTPEHTRNLNNVMQNYQFGVEGINQGIAGSRLGQQQEYLGYLQNLANQLYGQKEFNLGYNDQLLALQRAAQAYGYQTQLGDLSTQYQNLQLDTAGQQLATQLATAQSNPINAFISSLLGVGG